MFIYYIKKKKTFWNTCIFAVHSIEMGYTTTLKWNVHSRFINAT